MANLFLMVIELSITTTKCIGIIITFLMLLLHSIILLVVLILAALKSCIVCWICHAAECPLPIVVLLILIYVLVLIVHVFVFLRRAPILVILYLVDVILVALLNSKWGRLATTLRSLSFVRAWLRRDIALSLIILMILIVLHHLLLSLQLI